MRESDNFLLVNIKIYRIAFFLFVFFHLTGAHAQGLMFNSNDSLLNKRTSYTVFSTNPPLFRDNLSINFDLSLWDNKNLGYIFNLTSKNNSYSLSYLYLNGTGYLYFNIDRKSNKLKIAIPQSQLHKRQWIKVKVDFNLKDDKADVYVDNIVYHAAQLGLDDTVSAKIVFGKNQYYVEVPDMAIKNLTVGNDQKSFSFPLSESAGNIVHSMDGDELGIVENPVWLINDSYYWKPAYKHSFKQVAGLNFTPIDQKLFIFTRDSIIFYDSENGSAIASAFKKPSPVPLLLGKSIFNTRENKCYIYEVYHEHPTEPSVASLDMKSLTWSAIGKIEFKGQRHHHNIFYNANQDSIYLFGGYGSYRYYNDFFKYNPGNDQWERGAFKGDSITPRFFSAVSNVNKANEVYLFGGYGNESGDQVVGGRQYYDLYCINLQNHTIKKCWNIHPANDVFVPANNLVLSDDGKYFYAMCYPHEIFKTSIKLYKFSIKDGSYQVVSAAIPVISERIESDINLFLNSKTNQLLCTIQEFTDPNKSTIKVYSLAYPPVSNAGYLQTSKWQAKSFIKFKYIGGLVVILLIGASVWLYTRRRQKPLIPVADEPESEMLVDEKTEEQKINSVYLLGEFMVIDKKGRDITYLFSPKIKQLFILILLNSKENNGIGSKKISQLLWPDKDIAKTKNIKGVTFNHLRSAMGDIEGVELTFLNDIYFFNTNETFFCDYYQVIDVLKKTGVEKDRLIADHFELINRGSFLSDMTDVWLDDFKVNYEEQLMNELLPQLQKSYAEENYKVVLEISKLILNTDPFNDTALKYQLKSYRRLKGIDHSKKIYDQFITEYKKSLGVDYPISLDKILH
ncbi:kelch repeat-containing protein [Mucilaginibacter sp. X5P1]|uniref:Kelch repeat-containing protein n=1 Tax=Mucilaginibacter sp. X5P1 TaxID=2723088 RepID=UPI00161E44EC|nr:kelch repeat-containing protein [Mucilaginibacter sp. X5P1]MBB6138538.1 DNA-binding SARP family transcriptional activator [Mucilaginibacter sp. X5P1]